MDIDILDEGMMGDRPRHEVIKHLTDRGWISDGGKEHEKFNHPTAINHIAVPRHKKLSGPTLKAIIRQADEYRNKKPIGDEFINNDSLVESKLLKLVKEIVKEVVNKKKVKKEPDSDEFIANPKLTSDIIKS